MTGVYALVNIKDYKLYVGSAARSFTIREREHITSLVANKHSSKHLQAAWNRDGEEAFVFIILEICEPDKCLEREQYWIDYYDSANDEYGYNIFPTAGSPYGASWKLTDKQLQVATERNRETAKKRGESWRQKIATGNKERAKDPNERARLIEEGRRAAKLHAMDGSVRADRALRAFARARGKQGRFK